mmetsp:Transcript_620/g.2889  ORF Transcript_620/g.2889 Transcript_620/m.2889 type:complete len:214 (+) Transcript_620:767-1408(+)
MRRLDHLPPRRVTRPRSLRHPLDVLVLQRLELVRGGEVKGCVRGRHDVVGVGAPSRDVPPRPHQRDGHAEILRALRAGEKIDDGIRDVDPQRLGPRGVHGAHAVGARVERAGADELGDAEGDVDRCANDGHVGRVAGVEETSAASALARGGRGVFDAEVGRWVGRGGRVCREPGVCRAGGGVCTASGAGEHRPGGPGHDGARTRRHFPRGSEK